MSHRDPDDYGRFDHYTVDTVDEGVVLECVECRGTADEFRVEYDAPADFADLVKAASQHELVMDRST